MLGKLRKNFVKVELIVKENLGNSKIVTLKFVRKNQRWT